MMFVIGYVSGALSMIAVSGGIGWWLGRHPRLLVRHFIRGK